jgi:hypothetical protein
VLPNVKKVTAGDMLILQCTVASDRESVGWTSEPEGVVAVESVGGVGVGVALRAGQARLSAVMGQGRRVTLDLVSCSDARSHCNKI